MQAKVISDCLVKTQQLHGTIRPDMPAHRAPPVLVADMEAELGVMYPSEPPFVP